MKPVLLYATVALVSVLAGAAGAFGTITFLKPPEDVAEPAKEETVAGLPLVILPEIKVQAPLVFPNGRLAGYASFTFQLEVAEKDAARVTEELPVLLNAINVRSFRAPMARDPDGQIPDLGVFRDIVSQAHTEAFGKGVVQRVLIIEALPDS